MILDEFEKPEENNKDKNEKNPYTDLYNEEEIKYIDKILSKINLSYSIREQASPVFNGLPFSIAYIYNLQRGINYSPELGDDEDANIALGHQHETIITLVSIMLRNMIIKKITVKDNTNKIYPEWGRAYELMLDYSFQLENFKKKLTRIYYETYTQGDCFIFENWKVENRKKVKMYIEEDGEKKYIKEEDVDYSPEFLDEVKYEEGDDEDIVQTRKAVSIKMDGRCIIEGDPECENTQDQPFFALEIAMTREQAQAEFGNLRRWEYVPKSPTHQVISWLSGKYTLFNSERIRENEDLCFVHYYFNKPENKYNVFVNGLMMYDMNTPLTLMYPSGNYPISHFSAEVVSGSYRSRSIPMKLKNIADVLDGFLNLKWLQQIYSLYPPKNITGQRTIDRKNFRPMALNYGIKYGIDYHEADPEGAKRGGNPQDFSFVSFFQQVMEAQSLNKTSTGQTTQGALATDIVASQQNQLTKLGMLMDGIMNGYVELFQNRLDTIRYNYSKYEEKTIVDGKEIKVYQDIYLNTAGVLAEIQLRELEEGIDKNVEDNKLFEETFNDKKLGRNTEKYVIDPRAMPQHNIIVEVDLEPKQNSGERVAAYLNRVSNEMKLFPNVNRKIIEDKYLELINEGSDYFNELYEAPPDPNALIDNNQSKGNTAVGVAAAQNQ